MISCWINFFSLQTENNENYDKTICYPFVSTSLMTQYISQIHRVQLFILLLGMVVEVQCHILYIGLSVLDCSLFFASYRLAD